ncbi:glutamate formimidoyltransferase [candidate division WOR-1 bacterium RIFOXYC2_FULL_37_10]|uniref:glutamate formimidoyltransferase n=1 Tax=candidate division WOR-1 bacterium RIFOXYB2_FULL_37_13 TaxID=1802579 RepID=A0A1F4STP7_UNCSA|nr:MAG: glutamate formimidoyltransferase [candidate division WOR-1 bacterium RIFOXYA2_FULL_37_7]OGC23799.1 MAG: glutamate formimidoyltransferase [candidate division WOR-1 bacterium RIFOXYB2_FULL_37_13]OGC33299.1 MAG: glutamate formimidoyltransferase [candidate division WOR-1 bacterium RIFOXYC2_FULL_37_10]
MLLECVPNISEGRDDELVKQIISVMKNVDIRNLHIDPDHNRSVITFFGEPQAVEQAAYDMTERAMQLLDIHEHDGVHPYIGVVDVIPFVPYKDTTMETAVKVSHSLGKRLWKGLKLPVYYYGFAAKQKERHDLPYVRKGGYEVLKREISQKERTPDEGIGLHIDAGAVAIGARNFLIAFNVNLNTKDLSIAQSIAKNIREKHGGLKGVRALGLELKSQGIVQVSINLVDHAETSLKRVFEWVEKWAYEYNVDILESEIVGMIPKDVYFLNMEKNLRIKNFSSALLI